MIGIGVSIMNRSRVARGPSIVTAPVISGTVADGQTITLDTQPVWDASAVSSSWDWIVGGVSVQTGGTSYVMQAGQADIRVRATATDADGGTSTGNSNTITAQVGIGQMIIGSTFQVAA